MRLCFGNDEAVARQYNSAWFLCCQIVDNAIDRYTASIISNEVQNLVGMIVALHICSHKGDALTLYYKAGYLSPHKCPASPEWRQ